MRKVISLILIGLLLTAMLMGCGRPMEVPSNAPSTVTSVSDPEEGRDTTSYLRLVMNTPATLDPQKAGASNILTMNVFDRLVELQENSDGTSEIVPSIAKSWMISSDGKTYQFALNDTVRFHDGQPLTANDIRYSYERILTEPDCTGAPLLENIAGVEELQDKTEKHLSGIEILSDYSLKITLTEADGSFLAKLASPAASIVNRKSVKKAGKHFGQIPEETPGSGFFRFDGWDYSTKMVVSAYEGCWKGEPSCAGLVLLNVEDEEHCRDLFEGGELDVLDLDRIYSQQESFLKEEGMAETIVRAPREEIHFIVLNENDDELKDPEIRRALQIGTDRKTLLEKLYDGEGTLIHGIIPPGVIGYDAEMEELPYDKKEAEKLWKEKDPKDLEIRICCPESANDTEVKLYQLLKEQWEELGFKVKIKKLTLKQFGIERDEGTLSIFRGTGVGDINDPSAYLEPFFGSEEASRSYGLCYQNRAVITRVKKARTIVDADERMEEYHALEKQIVQDDTAWIPLYSRNHLFAVNAAVKNFVPAWLGNDMTIYNKVTVNRERGAK